MTAPRCVQLEEDVLLVVLEDNLIEGIGHDSVGSVLLNLRYRLALDRSGNLALYELGDKVTNSLGVHGRGLRKRVFELFLYLLDGERGPFGFLQIEGLGVVGELTKYGAC